MQLNFLTKGSDSDSEIGKNLASNMHDGEVVKMHQMSFGEKQNNKEGTNDNIVRWLQKL